LKRRRPGWTGWDAYAPFYDWENARTLGRRDVAHWAGLAVREAPPVLELGCGTGRLLAPLVRLGRPIIGIDRSAAMLARAQTRLARRRRPAAPALVRGDVTGLPFRASAFGLVIASYGMLQSLLDATSLDRALREIARVLRDGGLVGIDLVPDLPRWAEYRRRVQLRGRAPGGRRITLIETVRQDRRRRLTTFDEEFVVRRGAREDRQVFSLTFRTVAVDQIVARLARVGLSVEALRGDYHGGPIRRASDVWLVLARKK
jgi:SAM-dependent methyltransferase